MAKLRAAVITISDSRGPDDDRSGDKLVELLSSMGAEVTARLLIADDREGISAALRSIADGGETDLIMTTGGTGCAARDNTPEATLAAIEREVPGMAEAMRRETASKTPMAMLSRGVCGIRGTTLIVNLPGSTRGVEECFEVIRTVLGHAIDLLNGQTGHSEG